MKCDAFWGSFKPSSWTPKEISLFLFTSRVTPWKINFASTLPLPTAGNIMWGSKPGSCLIFFSMWLESFHSLPWSYLGFQSLFWCMPLIRSFIHSFIHENLTAHLWTTHRYRYLHVCVQRHQIKHLKNEIPTHPSQGAPSQWILLLFFQWFMLETWKFPWTPCLPSSWYS